MSDDANRNCGIGAMVQEHNNFENNPLVEQFSAFVAEAWCRDFEHQYTIKPRHAAWRRWSEEHSTDQWSCQTLREAYENYAWYGARQQVAIGELKQGLIDAITAENDPQCANICRGIFRWGGVSRKKSDKSQRWLIENCSTGHLCQRLQDAIAILQPHSSDSLSRFDGCDLLMNSSFTKVYAFGDLTKKVIIYDGRVGAALGLLARRFLERKGYAATPEALAFPWGPSASAKAARERTRDPSDGTFKFPAFHYRIGADLTRAKWAKKTNRILDRALEIIRETQGEAANGISAQSLEMGLFMVGYDVRGRHA